MFVIGRSLSFDAVGGARAAEAAGFDGVRVIDHFFSGIPPERPVAVPHAVATLAAAAAVTDRVLLTQTMFAATMRHPVELAQAVATLDRISGGRAELGLGAAWLPAEHHATGLALGSPAERVERLCEAVTISAEMLRNDGVVDFDGHHFRAHIDVAWPATPSVPEVMVGAHGPVTIRRVAPIVDRIDLLEAMLGGRPNFDDRHSNSIEELARRIALATSNTDHHLRFSATVNLQVVEPDQLRTSQETLAALAGCEVSTIEAERLRLVTSADEALDRFKELADIGIDRLHVRPADAATEEWLTSALPALQAL